MSAHNKIRLADIADKMGVSTVTVSKALADKDGVSEELRERIKQMAIDLGYRFKSAGKLRKAGSTGNIGVLIPARFFGKNSSFYWVLYNDVALSLLQHDYYCIMEILSPEDEASNRMPRMIQERKVDALVILGQLNESYLEFFAEQYSNFVLLDFYNGHHNFDSVTTDNFYCMYMLTLYLIKMGHKKIGFVGTFKSTTSIQDRYMGFLKAMMENNLDVSKSDVLDDRDDEGHLIPLVLPKKLPSAFVCNNDEAAAALIRELRKEGHSVPEDISVVGFDNYLRMPIPELGITTVEVDTVGMARTAVDLILKKLSKKPYNKGRNSIGGKLIFKDTVKKIGDGK